MIVKLKSYTLLIVLASLLADADDEHVHNKIMFRKNMIPILKRTSPLMSPEGHVLDDDGLKFEILYSMAETYWILYRPCYDGVVYDKETGLPDLSAKSSDAASCKSLPTDDNTGSRKIWNIAYPNNFKPGALITYRNSFFHTFLFYFTFTSGTRYPYAINDKKNDTYRVAGNWNRYGTQIEPTTETFQYTSRNFWNNDLSSINGEKKPFSITRRNPGPEMWVSSLKSKQNDEPGTVAFADCLIIHVYRNILKADAINGNFVQGPVFFIIGYEFRGGKSGVTFKNYYFLNFFRIYSVGRVKQMKYHKLDLQRL